MMNVYIMVVLRFEALSSGLNPKRVVAYYLFFT